MFEELAIFGLAAGVVAAIGAIGGIILWVYISLVLQTIGKKLKSKEPVVLAWIPIVQLYYAVRLAKMPGWYVLAYLLGLVPFIGPIAVAGFVIWQWWIIAEARKFPGWLGILMVIPIAQLIVPGVIAWAEK
jgi:hypothetical protein